MKNVRIAVLSAFLAMVCILLQGCKEDETLDTAGKPVSELNQENYKQKCSHSDFQFCKNKQVMWLVTVNEIENPSTIRVDFAQEARIDLHFELPFDSARIVPGVKLMVVGRIDKQGWVYDDVRNTRIISYETTPENVRAADEAKLQAKIQQQKTEDEANARQMHVSYPVYIKAKSVEIDAAVRCQSEVEQQARWGSRKDWLPNYSWSTDGKFVNIVGRDIQLKNGFNAQRYVVYQCRVNINDIRDVKVISVD